jgi:maleylpyruvate isomerase
MDGVTAVEGARDAHVRLLQALDEIGIDDAIARSESALPGWTIGHVLTHLARNADSHTRMIDAAKLGESVAQYPGGFAQRESEIEAGAGRDAAALLDDVRHADDELANAYAQVDDAVWSQRAVRLDRSWPVADLPFLRWREVAIHAIDLGLPSIGIDIWREEYVDHELRRQIAALAMRLPASIALRLAPRGVNWSTVVMHLGNASDHEFITVDCSPSELLAWTVGRSPGEPHWPSLTPWAGLP